MPSLRSLAEMIRFEHSVFALPFALVGMMYAANGYPSGRILTLILIAMVSARTAAMTFNRIADVTFDSENPRTKNRALVTGEIRMQTAVVTLIVSVGVFIISAALINRLTLMLAPIALFVLLGYSYTKRFTPLCHLFVGLSLGIAPAAAWIAVTGVFSWTPVCWLLGVTFWTGGFDVLYALQDEVYDRERGLKSLVVTLGAKNAILASRVFHTAAILFLVAAGVTVGTGLPYYAGCAFAGSLLLYEQSLVKPGDLSKLNLAFFTLNGYIAVSFFFFALIDVLTGSAG